MRSLKIMAGTAALAAFCSLSVAAQQPSSNPTPQPGSPQQSTPADPGMTAPQGQPGGGTQQSLPPQQNTAAAVPVPSTANAPEVSNTDLRPVTGELVNKLDTKTAKAGDAVDLKTTEKATIASGVVIPKGSKIRGHVIDVQAKGNGSDNSKVTVQFDQAELKDGQAIPIKSVLQSVAPAEMSANQMDASSSPGMASSAPGGSVPSTGGSMAGGGGSSASSGLHTGTSTSSVPTTSGSDNSASTAGNGSGGGALAVGTVVVQQGNVVIKTTAVPGVLIASNANGQPFSNASGALLGAKQNVHLDGGTHVVLAIADATTKGTNTR